MPGKISDANFRMLRETISRAGKESRPQMPLSVIVPKRGQRTVIAPSTPTRRFHIVKSKSFLVRMKEALHAIGCNVIVNYRENKMIVFNTGTLVPLSENHPLIVTDTSEKLIIDQYDGAYHAEFVKGPTEEGRWIAGRDWVVSQARKLLLTAPNQSGEATRPAPTPTIGVKAEPMEIEATTPVVVTSSVPGDGNVQTQVGGGEPMIAIRIVVDELREWEKSFHSRACYGGAPVEPVQRPMTPPVDYQSPWLLRKRRSILQMLAAKNRLQFWENSLGEFCFQAEPSNVPGTSSSVLATPLPFIVSDVFLPSYVNCYTGGDCRIPAGMMWKAEGDEMVAYKWIESKLKAHFNPVN